MAKVYEFLADGFEEVEALAPVDILRRGGVEVVTASIMADESVVGAHGIEVKADAMFYDLDFSDADLLLLPGGMPGTQNLMDCEPLCDLLRKHAAEGKLVAAICAAPSVLGQLGLLNGRKATCYPGFEQYLTGATVLEDKVVVDGNITTSRGAGAAMDFGYQLLSNFIEEEKVEGLKVGMIYK